MGEENVRLVATDDRLRMDVKDLDRVVAADLAAAIFRPAFPPAWALPQRRGGPIGEIAAVARRYALWLHVDAAYGAFAALAPSCRPFFEHIAEADSVALDPHKWLYLPIGCGCILYKDPAAARAAFSHDAEYLRVIAASATRLPLLGLRPRAFTPLPRPGCVADAEIRRDPPAGRGHREQYCPCEVLRAPGRGRRRFRMLAPVELSGVLLPLCALGFTGDLDALNQRIMVDLQKEGSSYLSNARIRGRFALRGCVLNYRTTDRDMEILLDDVRRAAGGHAPSRNDLGMAVP